MEVYIIPSDDTDENFEKSLADFHAQILFEKINKLDISNRNKKRIVDKVLEELKKGK